MASTNIEQGQNLLDLSLQVYGSVEELFRLIADNGLTQDGINTNLHEGDSLVYTDLPSQDPRRAVQAFYQNREIRVKTGELSYNPAAACVIPEGYVLWQFRIDTWAHDTVLLLQDTLATGCPSFAALNALAEQDRIQQVALYAQGGISTPEAAAYAFADWYCQYQPGYAYASGATVTLFLPEPAYPCGTVLALCVYSATQPLGGGAVTFGPNQGTGIAYPNQGKTRCCNSNTTNSIAQITAYANDNASYI